MRIDQAASNVIPASFRPPSKRSRADLALVELIARGDKEAMRALYCRHRVQLFRFSVRLAGDPTVAEDIVSEVFLQVWRRADRFEARSQVSTWLFAIARNLACSAFRQRPTEALSSGEIEQLEDCSDGPEVAIESNEQRAILAHCMRQLSPAHREVIDLVYYHEKSVSEVSEIVGIPPATVKSRMHYARREIADLFASYRAGTRNGSAAPKGERPCVQPRQVKRELMR